MASADRRMTADDSVGLAARLTDHHGTCLPADLALARGP